MITTKSRNRGFPSASYTVAWARVPGSSTHVEFWGSITIAPTNPLSDPLIRSAGISPTAPNSTGVCSSVNWVRLPFTRWAGVVTRTSPAYHLYLPDSPGATSLPVVSPVLNPPSVRGSNANSCGVSPT